MMALFYMWLTEAIKKLNHPLIFETKGTHLAFFLITTYYGLKIFVKQKNVLLYGYLKSKVEE